jgi:DNA-binding transcriptional regulator LsrR (DeoR family)
VSTPTAVTIENHQKCKEVYRLREQEGKGSTTISREVGISEATVKRWLANPTHFDPHLR